MGTSKEEILVTTTTTKTETTTSSPALKSKEVNCNKIISDAANSKKLEDSQRIEVSKILTDDVAYKIELCYNSKCITDATKRKNATNKIKSDNCISKCGIGNSDTITVTESCRSCYQNAYRGAGLTENEINCLMSSFDEKINTLNKVVAISTGESNSTALTTNGNVYSWGENLYGELGVGSSEVSVNVPTRVNGLSDIRYIEGGKGNNIAINKNNEVFFVGEE